MGRRRFERGRGCGRISRGLESVGGRLSQVFSHDLRRHNTVVARLARHLELGGSQLQNELHSQLRDQHNCGSSSFCTSRNKVLKVLAACCRTELPMKPAWRAPEEGSERQDPRSSARLASIRGRRWLADCESVPLLSC